MTKDEILKIPMQENDADAETIGDYLIALLEVLWEEEDSFSGKRPFGNSGWKYEVYYALVKAGAIQGEIDKKYNDLVECDKDAGDKLIHATIVELLD